MTVVEKLQKAKELAFTRKAPKPILLHGSLGVGKSAILQQVVYWARKNGWIVFNVKSARKWVSSGGIIEKSKVMPGHWDQPYVQRRAPQSLLSWLTPYV